MREPVRHRSRLQALEGGSPVGAETLGNVRVAGLLPSTREAKSSFGYVLLKPDVILRGLVDRAIETLAEKGLRVVDFRVGGLSDAHFAQLYQAKFRWDLDQWSFNRDAYRHGPVIGAVVWRSRADAGEAVAQDYLRRIKGSALPEEVSPDSLRGRFGATSRVFNAFHVPDDFEAARVAACMWFGQTPIADFLVSCREGCAPSDVGDTIAAEVSRHGYQMGRNLSGEATYFFVMTRLAHAIERELRLQGELLSVLRRMSVEYSSRSPLLAEPTAGFEDQCRIVAETLSRERSLFLQLREGAAVSSGASWSRLAQTVEFLIKLGRGGLQEGWKLEFLWFLLSEWRVFVSDLEKYLIRGSFIYPSVMLTAKNRVYRLDGARAL